MKNKHHTEETKKVLLKTLEKGWGIFHKRKVSIPQQSLFDELKILITDEEFVLEYFLWPFSIDIALPKLKLAIEMDGDFYHVNENEGFTIKYPIQKRNKKNDKAKNTFLKNKGWSLIRIWESEYKKDKNKVIQKIMRLINELKR